VQRVRRRKGLEKRKEEKGKEEKKKKRRGKKKGELGVEKLHRALHPSRKCLGIS